jgi:hypothetical protein
VNACDEAKPTSTAKGSAKGGNSVLLFPSELHS